MFPVLLKLSAIIAFSTLPFFSCFWCWDLLLVQRPKPSQNMGNKRSILGTEPNHLVGVKPPAWHIQGWYKHVYVYAGTVSATSFLCLFDTSSGAFVNSERICDSALGAKEMYAPGSLYVSSNTVTRRHVDSDSGGFFLNCVYKDSISSLLEFCPSLTWRYDMHIISYHLTVLLPRLASTRIFDGFTNRKRDVFLFRKVER